MTPAEIQTAHERRWSEIDEAIGRLPGPAREFATKYRTMVTRFGRFDPKRYAIEVVEEFVRDLQRCMDRQWDIMAATNPAGYIEQGSGV